MPHHRGLSNLSSSEDGPPYPYRRSLSPFCSGSSRRLPCRVCTSSPQPRPLALTGPALVSIDQSHDPHKITTKIIFEGEEKRGRPNIGDVVRIHYTCALQEESGSGGRPARGVGAGGGEVEGAVIENSRRDRRRPLEFVVGAEQVVKGIDRSIRQMLHGERARVFVTALYGYGDKGYPPMIPPRAALVFDVNLLDFWPRPRWQKPLVQVLSEPYSETPYAPRPSGGVGGGNGQGGTDSSLDGKNSVGGTSSADGSGGKARKQRDYPYGKVGRN